MLGQAPIGIFDSGVGGLTVAKAIANYLPNESFIYFGDTANMPYGTKSKEKVRALCSGIFNYMRHKQCKLIVVACNTATAAAYDLIKAENDTSDIAVVNVIDPVVQEVVESQLQKVGLIATKGTVKSGMYAKLIRAMNPNIEVYSKVTNSLASLIEEGFFLNEQVMQQIIDAYLSAAPGFNQLEGIIMGCTHYPVIAKFVHRFYDGQIKIFDSTLSVAKVVKQTLINKNLLNTTNLKVKHEFVVSDYTKSFHDSCKIFFPNQSINLVEDKIWTYKIETNKTKEN